LLIVAGMLYWSWPAWTRWRRDLRPLDAADCPCPEVQPYVKALCQDPYRRGELPAAPEFRWTPHSSVDDPFVFGRRGRYTVVLPLPFITLLAHDEPAVRAILTFPFYEFGLCSCGFLVHLL
jgi:hypothetical protein